ncbi:MAG: glycosyltransferase family 2 protein [Bacteroidetes bacterium]|nr:glycosyltransferase family 2 protein [Bacteroidota bacterium]
MSENYNRTTHRNTLSFVIPLKDEEESLPELFDGIRNVMEVLGASYEVIFIDDGSEDRSFDVIQALHRTYPSIVRAIRFRRNFGKAAALMAGFEAANGDVIITMDADLQDDPREVPELYEMLMEGYDLVSGWKKHRYDSLVYTIPSRIANFITSKLTGVIIHDLNCGLKAYRAEVAKSLVLYGDLYRYIPVLVHTMGYRVGEKVVQHHPRKYGKSKYTVGKFYRGFLDLLTVLFTAKYIQRPLHLFGSWGLLLLILGGIIDGVLSIEWLLGYTSLSNRPLFIVGVLLIILGVQFISLGLLGEMITRNQRPGQTYRIREML